MGESKKNTVGCAAVIILGIIVLGIFILLAEHLFEQLRHMDFTSKFLLGIILLGAIGLIIYFALKKMID